MKMTTELTTEPKQEPKAKQALTIRDHLESKSFQDQLAMVIPKHCDAERMARIAIMAMNRTPKLKECDQASFFKCLLDLSMWGLEPDGRRAHLIPFNNSRAGTVECQLIIDYKGLVELCMRSGDIASIHADCVCENDSFKVNLGKVVEHSIDYRKPRGAVYAFWAVVEFKDGGQKFEVMTKDEVDAIRQRSRAGSSGPWVTDYNEMGKKTVFRRLTKWIPLSAEIRDAYERDADGLEGVQESIRRVTLQKVDLPAIEGPAE
jgi:recombination protein RecT